MFFLSIVTPEEKVLEEEVYSLIAHGAEGYLEILSHHAPLVTYLKPGKLVVTNKNKEKMIYMVTGGILEVSKNKANLLADQAILHASTFNSDFHGLDIK